ncbi:MAG TPA: hemolysin family protein, partial [Chthoniobacteraceae bacterium]|nr:hemolysin family protein [Chthoniobacteraceae bacterium]
ALYVLQPSQIARLKQHNPAVGESLGKFMEHPRRLLSAVLLGDAVVNLPLIIICIFVLERIAPSRMHFLGEALIIFALVVLACDLAPKLLALAAPYRVARLGGITFIKLMPLLDPLCMALQKWSDAIANSITGVPQSPHVLNEGELEMLVQICTEEGALHPIESELIQEIIKLAGKTVKDCMTPRIDAFAIPDDWTNDEAFEKLRVKRHQRVPVYADTPDNILGVLDVKSFLLDRGQHYTEVMIPPSFVPETMRALDLFRSFLNHPQGMAIIVDEFGGTEGIVTISDMIEEIISDAVPSADHALYIEKVGDGKLIVNGSARLDDLAEITGRRFEEEGIDTVGGLIFNRLGYLPKPGAYFQIDDLSFTIRRTSRKRVEEMLIVMHHGGDGGEEAA